MMSTRTLTLCFEQLHRNQPGEESGADGEGAHLPDTERTYFHGGAEQSQHTVFCGESGQGGARTAVRKGRGHVYY